MSDYSDEIQRNFGGLTTDELLEKVGDGNLTEVAHEIALSELTRRGVDRNSHGATISSEKPQEKAVSTVKRDPAELAVLRKSSRPKFLIGTMAFVFIFRVIEHFAMERNTLGYGVEFAIRLFGNVVFGGLLWGYIVWWLWSRWRFR